MLEDQEQNIITITIKEIIDELSNYTGIDKKYIHYYCPSEYGYWGFHDLDELVTLINTENPKSAFSKYEKDKKFAVNISSNENPNNFKFYYKLKCDLKLDEIQSDGKTLLEHSREQLYFHDGVGMHCTGLVIDKDIENLNYKVNLNDLEKHEESKEFYPSELFNQIIVNLIKKRNKEKSKTKILK